MISRKEVGRPPRVRILELAQLLGEAGVARWCAGLLDGSIAHDDPGRTSLAWLGGRHAESLLRRSAVESRGQDYWPRVWGARGLMYVWGPDAAGAVARGLADPEWRVREMAAKVVRARELSDAEDALSAMAEDPVARVRAAALRALGRVGEVEHARIISSRTKDSDASVRRAADHTLAALESRLD